MERMPPLSRIPEEYRAAFALLRLTNARHGPESVHPGAEASSEGSHDHFRSATEAAAFLKAQGLGIPTGIPSARQLADLRSVADAVDSIYEGRRGAAAVLDRICARATFRYRPDGTLVPAEDGWSGFIAGLVPQLVELRRHRDRLRRCHNPRCRWRFLDISKNRSRRWCEMLTCGSRAKMRRYRERLRKDHA